SSEPAGDPKLEVGKYFFAAANMNFEVTLKDDKFTITVPGQPTFPLENIGGRRYKLGDPAPAGFFATFRPVKDKESETELFIEQPQGNVVLQKVTADSAKPTVDAATKTDNSLISVDELLAK